MNTEITETKKIIDRHSKSSNTMCRHYCMQFINCNFGHFIKYTLIKTLLHWHAMILTVNVALNCDDYCMVLQIPDARASHRNASVCFFTPIGIKKSRKNGKKSHIKYYICRNHAKNLKICILTCHSTKTNKFRTLRSKTIWTRNYPYSFDCNYILYYDSDLYKSLFITL